VPLSLPPLPQDYVELQALFDLSFGREARHDPDSPLRVHILPAPVQAVTKFEMVSEFSPAEQLLLNMQLEGYDPIRDRVVKRSDHVMVPETWQGMRLVGVTQHLGADNQGHYVTYKRRCLSSETSFLQWIRYDDSRTELQNTVQAVAAAAEGKLLFYMKYPRLEPCDSFAAV